MFEHGDHLRVGDVMEFARIDRQNKHATASTSEKGVVRGFRVVLQAAVRKEKRGDEWCDLEELMTLEETDLVVRQGQYRVVRA